MPTLTKRCLYCGKLYSPKNIWQKYCTECDDERMEKYRRQRKYRTCRRCRRTFLSIDNAQLCDRCKELGEF